MPALVRPALILVAAAVLSIPSARAATPSPEDATPLMLAYAGVTTPPAPEFVGLYFRPRAGASSSVSRSKESTAMSQIHGGVFDPEGQLNEQFNLGFRAGPLLSPQAHLGLAFDWVHKTHNISTLTSSRTGPGGIPIQVDQPVARATVDMFPIMAFLQVMAPEGMGIIPYLGGSAGWEVMVLTSEDYATGERFEGTYGGWGWQAWTGLGLNLGHHVRLNGEVYMNGAVLGRDVTDPISGVTLRETVNADGVGLRGGLAWGF